MHSILLGEDEETEPEPATEPLLWRPLPGVQTEAYYSEADEMFYGGAAGGGKSDLLLGLAMTAHKRSLILRRESTQLSALVSRSKDLIGTLGSFSDKHGWRGLPGKRLIELGGCKDLGNEKAYQGRPHDLKGFDELPEFLEDMYVFIIGWNRTAEVGQRCRIVGTGNPPTDSQGEWVIKRWGPWLDNQHPYPALPGELRYFVRIDDKDTEVESKTPFFHKGDEFIPKSRTFFPASVDDNPYYLATGYKAQLQSLPEPLRSQLLYGDFTVGQNDNPYQVIPTSWVLAAQKRWIEYFGQNPEMGRETQFGLDVARGGKDKTVLARIFGNVVLLETWEGKATPDGQSACDLVLPFLLNSQGAPINIDVIGYGSSAYERIKDSYPESYPVNFASKSHFRDRSKKLKAVNLRAEAYWNLRELLDPNSGYNLCLPADNELKSDLCAATYTIRAGGIQIEEKEEIRKRIGRSVDKGDAVALGFLVSGKTIISSPSVVRVPEEALRTVEAERQREPDFNKVLEVSEGGKMIASSLRTRRNRFSLR